MGFIEKIKSSVEMWRIEKYTKRRPVTSPDFEQKGTEIEKPFAMACIDVLQLLLS